MKGTGYRDARNYALGCNTCKYTKSNTEIIPLSNTPYKHKFLKSPWYNDVINDMLPTIGDLCHFDIYIGIGYILPTIWKKIGLSGPFGPRVEVYMSFDVYI